jgi:hypothetical protein
VNRPYPPPERCRSDRHVREPPPTDRIRRQHRSLRSRAGRSLGSFGKRSTAHGRIQRREFGQYSHRLDNAHWRHDCAHVKGSFANDCTPYGGRGRRNGRRRHDAPFRKRHDHGTVRLGLCSPRQQHRRRVPKSARPLQDCDDVRAGLVHLEVLSASKRHWRNPGLRGCRHGYPNRRSRGALQFRYAPDYSAVADDQRKRRPGDWLIRGQCKDLGDPTVGYGRELRGDDSDVECPVDI